MISNRYEPRTPSDWERHPAQVGLGLDELAARVKAVEATHALQQTAGKAAYWVDESTLGSSGVSIDPTGNISTAGDLALSAGDITIAAGGTVDGLDISDLTSGTGLITATGSGLVVQRTITAGDGVTVTNGNGVSGNPTVAVGVPILFTHTVSMNTNTSATSTTYPLLKGGVSPQSYGLVGIPYDCRLLSIVYKGQPVGTTAGFTFDIRLIASREASGGSTIITQGFTSSDGGRHIEDHTYDWSDNYAFAQGETVLVDLITGSTGWDGSNYLRRMAVTMTFGIDPADMPLLSA